MGDADDFVTWSHLKQKNKKDDFLVCSWLRPELELNVTQVGFAEKENDWWSGQYRWYYYRCTDRRRIVGTIHWKLHIAVVATFEWSQGYVVVLSTMQRIVVASIRVALWQRYTYHKSRYRYQSDAYRYQSDTMYKDRDSNN